MIKRNFHTDLSVVLCTLERELCCANQSKPARLNPDLLPFP